MYTNHRREISVQSVDLSSTGDKAFFRPGLNRYKIRSVAAVNLNTIGDAGIVQIDLRPTVGSDTDRVNKATLNIPVSLAAGKVVYKDALDISVDPGQEIVIEVTDACDAGDLADIVLSVEQYNERPANLSALQATS